MKENSETFNIPKKNIWTWLFNPFQFVAGSQSLTIGVILIVISCIIGSFSNSHFDGVLDFHSGAKAPLWVFIFEGLVDWLVMGFLLLFGGKLISKSHVRSVDVFGTQALARGPMLITALSTLLPGYQRFTAQLATLKVDEVLSTIQANMGGLILLMAIAFIALLMIIWMVALMYRAFSVSCNVRGGKAVAVFIVAVILGEAISKLIIVKVAGTFFV